MRINTTRRVPKLVTWLKLVQWIIFAMELLFLFALLSEVFLVPQMAPPWGDLPYQIEWAVLSLVSAVISGFIFLRTSEAQRFSTLRLLKTPPCISFVTVSLLLIVPVLRKWHEIHP